MSTGIAPEDPDFIYLGVDRKKLIAEQKPFDGKKNCWVPDEKEGYIRGEIESTKGDMVTVRKENMQVSLKQVHTIKNVNIIQTCTVNICNANTS